MSTARFRRVRALAPLSLVLLASCEALRAAPSGAGGAPDPRTGPVPLAGAEPGWDATLVLDAGVGIWCVKPFDVFPQYGTPELLACDDLGRLWVAISYSGKWTPRQEVHDGSWLGGLDYGEVDPRVSGPEAYVGSQAGALYQVRAYREGTLDCRRIALVPGEEVHTVVALDLDPDVAGGDLLVFTGVGNLFRVSPTGPDGTFEARHLALLPGRVRDALVLPPAAGDTARLPRVATVSRDGRLALLTFPGGEPRAQVLLEEPMGMGRLALAPRSEGAPLVLYATLDDGRVVRAEEGPDGWALETIHHGAQGPRGIAAGRFGESADQETVAVFGYSQVVELLTRGPDGWTAEPIFTDTDKGHWVTATELDGRNGTDELVVSGYSGRLVQLTRPVGFGLEAR